MANKHFRKFKKPPKERNTRGPSNPPMPEKTANWGGLPGAASASRNDGTPRVKDHPVREGM